MHKISGMIESTDNPKWPPLMNKYIMVQKHQSDNQIYIGLIKKILNNNVGVIMILVKGFEYPNKDVIPYIKASSDPKKFMLVIETDGWRYTSEAKIKELLSHTNPSYSVDNGPMREQELLYDDIHSGSVTLNNQYYASSTDNPMIDVPLYKLINSQDMDDFAFLTRNDVVYENKESLQGELKINKILSESPIEDDLTEALKQNRTNIIARIEGSEEQTQDQIEKKEDQITVIERMNKNPTKPQDILIVDNLMITNFVENPKTLQHEAEKIKRFLMEAFYLSGDKQEQNEDKLYTTLRFVYYGGYIHVFRTEIPLKEIITHNLLGDSAENPKLKMLGSAEYSIPIRHNVLKYILFQNEIQKNMNVDQQLLNEAELVLSQEYIIALTPEPRYQLWCVVRLIKLWYGDVDLQNNIRKIKLLVNQYRARVDKKYNIHNGIRFSIGIYPRYGKASATIVLKKIMYYFSLYFQAVGWKGNPPSYFKVVNDLVSYTNCDQSLKLYYRRIAEANGQSNNVFSKNFTKIISPGNNTDILEQYVKL
jgi:hypothetical protein